MSDNLDPELLELFCQESQERLARLVSLIHSVRQHKAISDCLAEIDRELHTIKGSAKMVGLSALGTFIHDVENLTSTIYQNEKVNQEKLDLLEECCDAMSRNVENLPEIDIPSSLQSLTTRLATLRAQDPHHQLRLDHSKPSFAKSGETLLPEPSSPPTQNRKTPQNLKTTAQEPTPQTAVRSAEKRNTPASLEEFVRIRSSKLVTLDTLVSDFIDSRLKIDHHEEELKALIKKIDQGHSISRAELKSLLQDFRDDKQHMSLAVKGLEQLAIDLRLRPLGRVFDQVARAARDLARQFGKKIKIEMTGETTELDRVVLVALKAPLAHVIRNVVDHGIEDPESRLLKGKPERGQIKLRAFQDGVSVVIQVEDDGAGVDTETLKARVLEKGLLTKEALEKLTTAEMTDLVFIPGLSTRAEASETSGRGVGMDVVRKNIEALKGEVFIESKFGQGTLIGLRVPLTLLISRVLLLRAGSLLLAIPTEFLESTFSIEEEDVENYTGQPVLRIRHRLIPIANLSTLLGSPETLSKRQRRLALVRHKQQALALEIDEFLGERSVVIKPLGWPLIHVPAISGAVILGSGEIALILQVPELMDIYHQGLSTPKNAGRHAC